MAKKIAVVLSGCGVFDGAEITEAVLTHLALRRLGFEVSFLAPDIDQAEVINHATGEHSPGERRNVLVEAARIARGHIQDVGRARAGDFDGAVFPGGYGAAKNLSTWASDGEKLRVNEDTAAFIRALHDAGKPLAFICIAPMVAARVLGQGVELTIGSSPVEGAAIDHLGGRHVTCKVSEWHVDREHKVVTTPAYMYDASILEVEAGINGAVGAFAELLG